jgi:2-(1,2-epoxy-1,2-dihydrophenyl)acetyl-CoA isomerase
MSTPDRPITLTVADGIARIVLNRPDRGNSIDEEFVYAFDDITLQCSERDDVRAVVIASTGPRFCVGGEIRDMVSNPKGLTLPAYIRKCNAILHGALARLQRIPAPSVAGVQGSAAGGGVSLLASCDIVVASSAARFTAAYTSIGYCCDMGGSTMLTRRLGTTRARRFYLLHEQLDAATAAETGLADIVVAPDELAATVEAVAKRWAAGPTAAYGAIRSLLASAACTPYETQMELETQALVRLTRTEDATQALHAFLEKVPAKFVGR